MNKVIPLILCSALSTNSVLGLSPGYFSASRNQHDSLEWMLKNGWKIDGVGLVPVPIKILQSLLLFYLFCTLVYSPRGWTVAHVTAFDGAARCLKVISLVIHE